MRIKYIFFSRCSFQVSTKLIIIIMRTTRTSIGPRWSGKAKAQPYTPTCFRKGQYFFIRSTLTLHSWDFPWPVNDFNTWLSLNIIIVIESLWLNRYPLLTQPLLKWLPTWVYNIPLDTCCWSIYSIPWFNSSLRWGYIWWL